MLRPLLLKASALAKENALADYATRYNPYFRWQISRAIAHCRQMQNEANPGQYLLKRILQTAQNTRYGVNRSNNLADWPLLEKETIRKSPQDFIRPSSFVRIPFATGGTSGIPLKLWRSMESVVAEQMFIDNLLAPYGMSMRSKTVVLRGDNWKSPDELEPPYGYISNAGKRLIFSPFHLNASNIHWYHEAIQRFEPSILWIYPNTAVNLLSLLEQANLRLTVPLVLSSSEVLPESVHIKLQEQFNCPVVNYYGQSERLCFAYGTKPNELYFDPYYGHVELGALEASECGNYNTAKIIGTNYWNHAMPLIRYNTGDSIYIPKNYSNQDLDLVAIGKLPFIGIAGREGEYIILRDGTRILVMNQIARNVENIYQMQMVQTDFDNLFINVIAMPGFSAKDATQIRNQALAKIPKSVNITVQPVERLKTTPRGKTPLVVRTFSEAA